MRQPSFTKNSLCLLFVFIATTIFLFCGFDSSISSSAKALITSQFSENDAAATATLKIVRVDLGSPKLTLLDKGGLEQRFELKPGATITLNGESARAIDLHPDDTLFLKKDENGLVTAIDARRAISGIVVSVTPDVVTITPDYVERFNFKLSDATVCKTGEKLLKPANLRAGDHVYLTSTQDRHASSIEVCNTSVFAEFWNNFKKNLFKPLLLFFYLGFALTILRVPFEFPPSVYQGLTIYLLVAIGWHGGEELACLSGNSLLQAALFMVVGFVTNLFIGFLAYFILRGFVPKLRKIDAATVAGYYGSDSAGTFVTALGVLQTASVAFAAYMPVMLAVMEIPGCLVGLFLASRLRHKGMDKLGNMPGEPNYRADGDTEPNVEAQSGKQSWLNPHILREIFLNPGIFLLSGGILIGLISRLQGPNITAPDDTFFVSLFQGILCLFLLEMGMTAAKRIRDLKTAGKRFVLFGLLVPNIFALIGISVASVFSHVTGQPLQLGTYVLFAVLCGAASYIAVPAIQRLAIPEASPTLPLAASLGLTFTYNVTIGIPLYLAVSETVVRSFPVF